MKANIYYKVNESLVISEEQDHYIAWDRKNGWKLELTKQLLAMMQAYGLASTKAAVFRQLHDKYGVSEDFFNEIHTYLVEQGLVLPYHPEATKTKVNKNGMFRTPIVSLDACLEGEWCDLAFIGMPYDLNVTYKPGTRFAPGFLRRVSGSLYQYDGETNQGMYDPVEDKQTLEGIRMVDCGDINAVAFEKNGKQFDALTETIQALSQKGIFPVTIGGDHSITLPCIKGISKNYSSFGVIQLDAHTDFGLNKIENWREQVHHGNFMDAVIDLNQVEHVVQIGIRQLSNQKLTHHKVTQFPGDLACRKKQGLIEALRNDIPYYVTIDIDVLDPSLMPATGTPLPGGLLYTELKEILNLITSRTNIIGLDFVEFMPKDQEVDGVIASEVILKVISNVMEWKNEHLTQSTDTFTHS